MAFTYTTIDGKRVNTAVARQFQRMEADFKARFGLDLIISDGTRSYAEQKRLWEDYISGRSKIRAANPDSPQAFHVETNPSGPRAIDIRDSGADAGVTKYGNVRSDWIRDNAKNYGFDPRGYREFNEPWHLESIWALDQDGGQPAGGGAVNLVLQQQQNWLIHLGYDLGPTGADGVWGPKTEAAIKAYQQDLKNNWGYTGDIDGQWGPNTQQAHERKYAAMNAPSNGVPPFPLQPGQYFGPEGGGANSISGWHSHNADLKVWQQRMKDRGWPITVDGLYGPKGATTPQGETANVAKAFQAEKNLTVDGLIGTETWTAAWTAPVTPPPAPPVDPTPETPPTAPDLTEAAATPSIVTPTAADFPAWIRYEEKFDQQMMANPKWNADLQKYYGKPYLPIESHTHWWGEPGKAGTHDGNVTYLNATKDVGTNYVTSPGRITLCSPLNKIALTTGQRNPFAWKSENDPLITTSTDDLGYKTLGYLHYIVEVKNPHLRNEAIRLHKEVLPGTTSCSNIDTAKVRAYAEKFHSGALDPATGEPPVVIPDPDPEPSREEEYKKALEAIVAIGEDALED